MKKEITEIFKAFGVPDKFYDTKIQKEVNLATMTMEEAEQYHQLGVSWLKKKKP